MARRPNYDGEKRRKEIQRQKKREEKDEKKRLRKEAGASRAEDGSRDEFAEQDLPETGAVESPGGQLENQQG